VFDWALIVVEYDVDGQDKGVTAFLTELGEGKLLGADSLWAQSLRHQEYVLYMTQAAAHQAAEQASQAKRTARMPRLHCDPSTSTSPLGTHRNPTPLRSLPFRA